MEGATPETPQPDPPGTRALTEPPGLGRSLLYLWRLSRPETWMVSFLPAYVGWLLATRELVPGLDVWVAFWAEAVDQGASTARFFDALAAWMAEAWPLGLALVVLGPLLWAATLLVNDVHDLPGDRLNPRKARSPLVQGLVSEGLARRAAYAFAGLAVVLALAVNLTFTLLVVACLVLAWAYSAPPVRLKTRPGADVAVNAIGVGALAALAGWSVAAPLAAFPFVFLPQGLLVAIAVYVPTTLVDHDADEAAGYATLATHLGPRVAYRIGWWAWVAANAGALALAYTDTVLPRRLFPLLVIFVPLLLYEYHVFIGRARSPAERVRGIVLASFTFLAVNLVFALMYTGLWTG